MNKTAVVTALRQMLTTAQNKLDVMVKPDVVYAELMRSRQNLCNNINNQVTNRKDLLSLMIVVNKVHINPTAQGDSKRLAFAIRECLLKLPSIVEEYANKRK